MSNSLHEKANELLNNQRVNDTGIIPDLRLFMYSGDGKSSRPVYYKKYTLMMGIFQGVGISKSVLNKVDINKEILIVFEGNRQSAKYNGVYLAKIKDFIISKKTFNNYGNDLQHFLSFKDMVKIK